jgi:hypothetical protein
MCKAWGEDQGVEAQARVVRGFRIVESKEGWTLGRDPRG